MGMSIKLIPATAGMYRFRDENRLGELIVMWAHVKIGSTPRTKELVVGLSLGEMEIAATDGLPKAVDTARYAMETCRYGTITDTERDYTINR